MKGREVSMAPKRKAGHAPCNNCLMCHLMTHADNSAVKTQSKGSIP
jgi:hypothetical protein